MVSITPREPFSKTLFRLCNLDPRSTQNTDNVSSINFPNLNISCLMIVLLYYQDYLMHMLTPLVHHPLPVPSQDKGGGWW